MSLFKGAVIHGGQFTISINSLNQSPKLFIQETKDESPPKQYKRLKVLDSDSDWKAFQYCDSHSQNSHKTKLTIVYGFQNFQQLPKKFFILRHFCIIFKRNVQRTFNILKKTLLLIQFAQNKSMVYFTSCCGVLISLAVIHDQIVTFCHISVM